MSDEVAEDYRIALEALTLNSRYEISNLTVIAKENTEHALAISEALKNHIKTTSPQKKLPSFYVLDSVVKNVGTPYTLFFGRQLFATFMEAYALVDNNVRRKMDEMLKTWKEPVPGSMDTRPVFPPEVTRPIENALIKAKTSFLQAHQEHMRTQQQLSNRGRQISSQAPYNEAPTPQVVYQQTHQQQLQQPSSGPNYPNQQYFQSESQQYFTPPTNQPYSSLTNGHQYPVTSTGQHFSAQSNNFPGSQTLQAYIGNGKQFESQPNIQQYSTPPGGNSSYGLSARQLGQQFSQPTNILSWPNRAPQSFPTGEASIDTLNSDIDRLISESKAAWARNMQDTAASTRLKALLDLQSILQNQKLPPDQIALIKIQVAQVSEASKAQPIAPAPPAPALVPSIPAPPNSLDSILGPGALAALLSRQPKIPPPIAQTPAQSSYQHVAHVTSSAPPTESNAALLEKLRAAGIIGANSTANSNANSTANSIANSTAKPNTFLNTLPGHQQPSLISSTSTPKPLVDSSNDVVLKQASLKIPRPHLISSLYEKLGVPCTQCGRRFQSDTEGKKKKEAHMDWHFRVRRRMEEAETRGQHRSWYVDELDWIKTREVDIESCSAVAEVEIASTNVATANPPKLEYIPVPEDAASTNRLCPICQEKFEMKWLDEAQEFVWMDARNAGEKTYHASCYAEVSKNVQSQLNGNTPEPTVLGKRKSDDDHIPVKSRIKSESMA
ncbi:hypothetical protein K3495_g728 [Podosphaera aphanis]|nr:hypothetical protein K3495_g728 [Podosphaera aphanis]